MELIDPTLITFEQGKRALHSGLDGTVALGCFNGQNVAVKRFAIRNSQSVLRFEKEAKVLELETLRNIVRPLGLVRTPPHYWLIMPYYDNGDLGNFSMNNDRISLPLALCLCYDASQALQSVHDAGLVFRDFKSANVLVSNDLRARLTDFGSVQDLKKGIEKEENEMGPSGGFHKRLMEGTTLLYAAPEVVSLESRNELDLRSDIYSLGITMCEILTRIRPYESVVKDIPAMNTVMDATYNEQSLLSAICNSNLRPPLEPNRFSEANKSKDAWKALIQSCWSSAKQDRPFCAEVVDALKVILNGMNVDPNADRKVLLLERSNNNTLQNSSQKVMKQSFPEAPPLEIKNPVSVDPCPLWIGAFATSGRRGPDKMEDRHSVSHSLLRDGQTLTVIVVLDGHGGQGAAAFSVKELGPAIHDAMDRSEPDADSQKAALSKAFLDTDLRFQALCPDDKSGTTALAVVILTRDGKVTRAFVANAGDCRAVVAQRNGTSYVPVRLTKDHNADQASEQARIKAAGGQVVVDQQGNCRVQGHIQVTRSIGDTAMKRFGVTAEPEIDVVEFKSGVHDFLVLGTDGLFDFMNDAEVIQGVLDTAKEPGLSSKRLGSDSIARGGTDNVTSVVVFMRKWDKSGKADWE